MGKEAQATLFLNANTSSAQSSIKELENYMEAHIISKIDQIQKGFQNVALPADLDKRLGRSLDQIQEKVDRYQNQLGKNDTSREGMETTVKLANDILNAFDQLSSQVREIDRISGKTWQHLIPSELTKDLITARSQIKGLSTATNEWQSRINDVSKQQAKLNADLKEQQTALDNFISENGVVANYQEQIDKLDTLEAKLTKYNQLMAEAAAAGETHRASGYKGVISTTKGEIGNIKAGLAEGGLNDAQIAELKKLSGAVSATTQELANLATVLSNLDANKVEAVRLIVDELNKLSTINIDRDTINSLTDIFNALNNIRDESAGQAAQQAQQFGASITEMGGNLVGAKDKINATTDSLKQFDSQLKDTAALESRIAYFFSMGNAIMLMRRAIRSAFNSVKELDAIMTQTAVVTNFDVSDMWEQLPEYTERANELGVAIADVYKASTLYYQQGLSTNEVMQVTNATLKMARIAGLDAAEATDKMTAALRGFNMVVNETNADRVSDVYSKLAAITASDVEEISTAMTKTASIASNAGMQFETTAAFLSQIIETTRESAETAGTALKTVIARFSELKKDPAEIGEVDGEVIDANKIETALRSVGISLRDTSGQFRDLDQVFLDIASRWDTLDRNTQRYIATIAAGSRQQSRFIAMMSNYSRTQELVAAANNAAGASQKQYEKTLESMQTHLARLKNAWDEFVLGITNAEVLKAAVKALTKLIEAINALTKQLPSVVSSFAKLGVAIGALKGGRALFKAFKDGSEIASKLNVKMSALQKLSIGLRGTWDKTSRGARGFIDNLKLVTSHLGQGSAGFKQFATLGKDAFTFMRTGAITVGSEFAEVLKPLNLTTESAQKFALELRKAGVSTQTFLKIASNPAALQNLNQCIQQGSSGTQLYAEAQMLATMATDESAAASTADGAAKTAEATATWQAVGASLALKAAFAGLIAVVALVVVGIVALVKHLKFLAAQKDTEARLSELNEQIQSITQSIDELNDAQDNWKDINKELDNSIKGTSEWYAALAKVNAQVFDLIDKYPFLKEHYGEYIIKDESGRYSIIEAGWKAMAEQNTAQLEAATRASESLLASAAIKFTQSSEATIDKYIEEKLISKWEPYLGQEKVDELITKFIEERNKGLNVETAWANLKNFTKGTNAFNYVFQWSPTSDFIRSEIEKSGFTMTKQLVSTPEVMNYMSSLIKDAKPELTDATINALAAMGISDTDLMKTYSSKNIEQEWKKEGGIGDQLGYTQEQKEQMWKDTPQLVSSLVRSELAKTEYAPKIDTALKTYKALSPETQRVLSGIQYAYLSDLETATAEIAKIEDDELRASAEALLEIQTNAKEWAEQQLKRYEIQLDQFNGTLADYKQIASGIARVGAVSGKTSAQNIANAWNQLITGQSDETKRKINSVFQFDWTNLANWDELDSYIEAASISDEKLIASLKSFANQAKIAAKAVYQVDLTTVNSRLKTIGTTLNDLFNGQSMYKWESDVYDALIASVPKLKEWFRENLDGTFSYVGGTMSTLVKEIEDAGDVWQKNLAYNEAILKIAQQTIPDEGFTDRKSLNVWLAEAGITDEILTAANMGFTIAGVANLSDDEFEAIKQKIVDLVTNRATYEAAFETYETILNNLNRERALSTSAYLLDSEESFKQFAAALNNNDDIPEALKTVFARGLEQLTDDPKVKTELRNLAMAIGNTINTQKAQQSMEDLGSTISDYYTQLTSSTNLDAYLTNMQLILNSLNLQADAWSANSEKLKDYQKLIDGLMSGDQNAVNAWLGSAIGGAARGMDYQQLRAYINSTDVGRTWAQANLTTGLTRTVNKTDTAGQTRTFYEFNDQFLTNALKQSGAAKTWQTQYEWLYDMNEKINAQMRVRTRLEKQYERALKQTSVSTQELQEISLKELKTLEERSHAREREAAQAKSEIQYQLKKYKQFAQYVTVDYSTGQIAIDYDAVNKKYGSNEEQGQLFEEFISRIEKLRTAMTDAEDDLQDILDEVEEIRKRGRDEYRDLEISVRDALIDHYTKQIDLFDSVSQAIESANSKLIDEMTSDVQARRQARTNAETEQDLTDKRRRLGYLQMDSSGANALEIMQLSEELAKAEQAYGDTLVDQALEQMRTDNEKAAEQRNEQIQLMRDQLQYAEDSGALWAPAQQLLAESLSEDGLVTNSTMVDILKESENWAALSEMQKEDWEQQISQQAALASMFAQGIVGENAEATLSTVHNDLTSVYDTLKGKNKTTAESWFNEGLKNTTLPGLNLGTTGTNTIYSALTALQGSIDLLSQKYDVSWKGAVNQQSEEYKMYLEALERASGIGLLEGEKTETYRMLAQKLKEKYHFASGGLATTTGPAWLDGSSSQPELVLNPTDTRNFLILRDALSSLTSGNVTASSSGDNYYDINIDATLTNDYDVEQLGSKIKDMIVDDAMYRNVTAVNRLR